jgi:two-component system response regulator HydG
MNVQTSIDPKPSLKSIFLISQAPGRTEQLIACMEASAQDVFVVDAAMAPEAMKESCSDLAIIDGQDLSPGQCLELLLSVMQAAPKARVVVACEKPGADWVVRFVQAGAYDCISGPLDGQAVGQLVAGLVERRQMTGDNQRLYFSENCPAGVPMAGRSAAMDKVLEIIRIVAQSRCNPVLIVGKTGTGKELAAKAVHAWRYGQSEPMIAINCAALTPSLLESELFGHVKGAFTGADREKTGLFAQAGMGSVFLDEISEMPLELQAKLLRVLQEKTFRKVGGTVDITCHATIIASSNRDLFGEMRAGRFRGDLYYRLAVFPIKIPPLAHQDRREDIALLADYFLQNAGMPRAHAASLTPEARAQLLAHDWPGNVRELKNVIERALIIQPGPRITKDDIIIERPEECPPALPAPGFPSQSWPSSPGHCGVRPQDDAGAQAAPPPACASINPADFSLQTAEREFIYRALKEVAWQRNRAAALLGITRATLHAKIKRYGIKIPGSQLPADDLEQETSTVGE